MVTLIGNYLSPYVRKVLVCLDLKAIPYEIDPIIPFFGNDEFTRLNPDRRVPVLIDGDLVISDSSVICEYLDESYPGISLLPVAPADREKARALQLFADQQLGDILIWRLFNQLVIKRFVWNEAADAAVVTRALNEEIPVLLEYLESVLTAEGFLFGELGIADIAIATMFRNAAFAQFNIDATRWPRTNRFVGQVLEHPSFVNLTPFEEVMLRTPIARHRAALLAAGAPVSVSTLGGDKPRKGPLSV